MRPLTMSVAADASLAGRLVAERGCTAGLQSGLRSGPENLTMEVDRTADGAWDRIVAGFADANYDQTSAYTDTRWGRERISTLVLREGGRPVACARVVIVRPPLLRAGLAYVKFGPLWRSTHAPADPMILRRMIAALVDEYCGRRGHRLTVLPRPSPDHNALEEQVLRTSGLQPRASLDPLRYLVDVSLAPEEQLASLGQKWRYNLRKAMQAGLEIALADLDNGVDEFAAMHRAMVARKRFSTRDAVDLSLRAMAAGLPASLRPTIVFARKDGRALAGAVVGLTGDLPVYLFGASRDEALHLNAGYLLQWWIVNWLRDVGQRWYDLGGGAMDARLEQFKRGLVGKAGHMLAMPGEHDAWAGMSGRIAGELVYKARDLQRLTRAALSGR
jgi:hypothetical protein